MSNEHEKHLEKKVYVDDCPECQYDEKAVDWLQAVRRFGLEKANLMFP